MSDTSTDSPQPIIVELPAPTNVIAAIARVEAEIGGIRKLTPDQRKALGMATDAGISYAYRSIDQIAQAAQPLFGHYGVVFVPNVTETVVDKIVKGNASIETTNWTRTTVTVTYRVYGPGGLDDFIETDVVGVADDNSDKGMNKAMTSAFKNLLLRLLCIGDPKDDPDNFSADGGEVDRTTYREVKAAPASDDELNELNAQLKPPQRVKVTRYAAQVLGIKVINEPGEKSGELARAMRNVIEGREPDDDPPTEPTSPDTDAGNGAASANADEVVEAQPEAPSSTPAEPEPEPAPTEKRKKYKHTEEDGHEHVFNGKECTACGKEDQF